MLSLKLKVELYFEESHSYSQCGKSAVHWEMATLKNKT
jgi:hypothetical protein